MATDGWSWVFSVDCNEVPSPVLDSRSPEFAAMFQTYPEDLYLENYSPRNYPHSLVLHLAARFDLPALKYLEEAFVVLRGDSLQAAVAAYDVLLQACRSMPERIADYRIDEPAWGVEADDLSRLAGLADAEFWKDENRKHPHYFLEDSRTWMFVQYLRSNRHWLDTIHRCGRCGVYLLLQH